MHGVEGGVKRVMSFWKLIEKLEEIMQQLSSSLNISRINYMNEKAVNKEQVDFFQFAAKGIDLV